MTKGQKCFYRIGQAAGIVLVLIVFWFGAEEHDFIGWRTEPHAETGRTIPVRVKGGTIYVSKSVQALDLWLSITAYGAGIVTVVCLIFSGEVRRIGTLGPSLHNQTELKLYPRPRCDPFRAQRRSSCRRWWPIVKAANIKAQ